jgi:NAD(P)-dependent dehydrogenase (short-subunit alcohol dehydrogenase family)
MSASSRFSLDNKVVVVTGASSGIGAAICTAFGEAGATLVLGARREEQLHDVRDCVRKSGALGVAHRCDVSIPEDCDALIGKAMNEFGRVDVLINNAGVGTSHPSSREMPDQFRAVIDVNLNGAYWMAQACGRVMKPGSSIVNISSVLALTTAGLPQAAYSASKAGLLGLTRDLATQWTGRKGIRVNALLPGFFATEMTEQYDPEYLDQLVSQRVLIGRLGMMEEICSPALFLASDASSYVTGISLPVDGGYLLT